MENIENNNAVDYIQNRNEIGIVIEPEFTVNRNIVTVEHERSAAPLLPENESQLIYPSASHITLNIDDPIEIANNNDIEICIAAAIHKTESQTMLYKSQQNENTTLDIESNIVTTELQNANDTNPFRDNAISVDLCDVQINIDENPLHESENTQFNNVPVNVQDVEIILDNIHQPQTVDVVNISTGTSSSDSISGSTELKSTTSPSINSSNRTSLNEDVNSVEEALRALDFAISGEESLNDEDDVDVNAVEDDMKNIETTEDICISTVENPNLHKVIEFLINNSANNLILHAENEQPDHFDNEEAIVKNDYDDLLVLESVRSEAKLLVDNIIDECEDIVSRKLLENIESSKLTETNSNIVQTCVIESSKEPIQTNSATEKMSLNHENGKEIKLEQIEQTDCTTATCTNNVNEIQTTPNENDQIGGSMENLFFNNIEMEASTPFISKQQNPKDFDNPRAIVNKKIMQNLFGNDYGSPASTISDQSNEPSPILKENPVPALNATYNAIENTTVVLSPVELNKTTVVQDTTFVKDSTFTMDSTFTKDTNITQKCPPPTIKISDSEETVSEDLTTATPVNTPIELNYSLASWDKFISSSMTQQVQHVTAHTVGSSFDPTQPCTSAQAAKADAELAAAAATTTKLNPAIPSCSSSGWFLHPQEMSATAVTVFSAGDTFCMDDEEDDEDEPIDDEDNVENAEAMNLTFDALRKSLVEALPHAQGATSMTVPLDYSDDDDDDEDAAAAGNRCDDDDLESRFVLYKFLIVICFMIYLYCL